MHNSFATLPLTQRKQENSCEEGTIGEADGVSGEENASFAGRFLSAVPRMHVSAHQPNCGFSQYVLKGVRCGRTVGEVVECSWSERSQTAALAEAPEDLRRNAIADCVSHCNRSEVAPSRRCLDFQPGERYVI